MQRRDNRCSFEPRHEIVGRMIDIDPLLDTFAKRHGTTRKCGPADSNTQGQGKRKVRLFGKNELHAATDAGTDAPCRDTKVTKVTLQCKRVHTDAINPPTRKAWFKHI